MHHRRDHIDEVMAQITSPSEDERASKELNMRLRRVAHHLETELRRELAAFGIELWEMELLGALKRAGEPYQLSAGELLRRMRVTSGGVTKRVAGLERKGWVRRDIDPDDRRQILVSLTDEGVRRAYEVFDTKTETEARLLGTLSLSARRRLNDDLRRLLLDWEGPSEEAS
ncbi:MarR family transcriptional regulator [Amycolatopsis acidicola]|uniref:MarR family transcriptional regulator n=1 Tax=Amycolatopsis acidicola TaxID=2596893 RepID=A0A5N0V1A3_9PSEU|nr:MarR family transcriptional regulator [Amycolatopsis acidicola]KAA9158069.1 MarR family transcriptional regulator [Amycolatopsis acidicola]